LADLDDQPAQAEIRFANCDHLGAVNLRGTGFATRNPDRRVLTSVVGGEKTKVALNVANLAGFLLAKAAAARQRRKEKDWYDIVFVLLHNDKGGLDYAINQSLAEFGKEITGEARNSLEDLQANFANPRSQGARAYAEQIVIDHLALDLASSAAEAVIAVRSYTEQLLVT
jgi:hypothetical protein